MAQAVLGLFLLPAVAWSADCPPPPDPRPVPCTPSNYEKQRLVGLVRAALNAQTDADAATAEEKERRQMALPRDAAFETLEAWELAYEEEIDSARRAKEAMTEAFTATIKTYGFWNLYNVLDGITSGPYKGMGTMPRPRFQKNEEVFFMMEGTDRREHYNGHDPKVDGDSAAETLQDGKILIYPAVLEIVLEQGNPRLLALALHHEAVHFQRLTSGSGWTTRQNEEALAYDADIQVADLFELRPNEKRDLYAQRAKNRRAALVGGTPMHDPAAEARYAEGWAEQEQRLAEIRRNQEALEGRLTLQRWERAAAERTRRWVEDMLAREREAEAARRRIEEMLAPELRTEKNRRARQTLTDWAQNICKNGSIPDSNTAQQVKQAYEDVLVEGEVFNLWDPPDYTGIPCPTLLINLLMRDKLQSRTFRDWDDWSNMAIIANERSRSSPPPAGIEEPVGRNPTAPSVPHCRYHPWCQQP